MSEIPPPAADAPTVVSTFTGAGGTCLGFRMAGFRTLWASEFIPAARETYRANFPGVHVDERDIREVSGQDILDHIKMEPGELDVLEGSPPCASFSINGKRERQWGMVRPYSDTKQRTDDLFFEYARLVAAVQPKVFVAENVPGMKAGKAYGYFKLIMEGLRNTGYRVRAKILDASYLGVPQQRKRLIFIGVRNDLNCDPVFPQPLPYRYTVTDALKGVVADSDIEDRGFGNVSIETTSGRIVRSLTAGQAGRHVTGKNSFWNLSRLHPDKPSTTLLAGGGISVAAGTVHPIEPRFITISEVRRISSFPDDFIILGNYRIQFERIGRAVPPVMSKAIAETIRAKIL